MTDANTDTDTDTPQLPDRLGDASPATKLVYLALAEHEHASMDDLAEFTLLSESTISWALDRLREREELTTRSELRDARRNRYTLREEPPPP